MGAVKTIKREVTGSWNRGAKAGAISGLATGVPLMLDIHPFLSYVVGGLVSGSLIKNPDDKRGVIRESVREAIIQLFAAE